MSILKVVLSRTGVLALLQAQSDHKDAMLHVSLARCIPVIGLVEAQKHGGFLRQAAWEVLKTAAVAPDHGNEVNTFSLCNWYHLISL